MSRDFKLDSSPFQNLSRLQVQKLSFKHLNIFVIQDLKISNLSRRSARPVDDASSTGHLPTTKLLCIFTTQIRATSEIWIFVLSNCIPGLGTVIRLRLVLMFLGTLAGALVTVPCRTESISCMYAFSFFSCPTAAIGSQ
ncbi:hypothetical protein B0H10DRAFT_2193638 [Mycena sp. CBHHK59/15]|nr:hypothetical protein B0H10DRAFT_2193638 [Mycena sp. CBHHK59/15]